VDGRLAFNPAGLCPHVSSSALVLDNEIHTLHNDPVLVLVPTDFAVTPVDLVSRDYAMHSPL
jgi:hypothetical protein